MTDDTLYSYGETFIPIYISIQQMTYKRVSLDKQNQIKVITIG